MGSECTRRIVRWLVALGKALPVVLRPGLVAALLVVLVDLGLFDGQALLAFLREVVSALEVALRR